jgi:hypothetical protein
MSNFFRIRDRDRDRERRRRHSESVLSDFNGFRRHFRVVSSFVPFHEHPTLCWSDFPAKGRGLSSFTEK